MTLQEQFPEVRNVAFEADPRPDNPQGTRAVIDAVIDMDARDPEKRRRNAELTSKIEETLRKTRPFLTSVTLRTFTD